MVRPTGETMSKFDRRQALKAGGTLAVAALVGSDARSTLALPPAPSEEQLEFLNAGIGKPGTPPLEVLVFNRLAYGPRPGDLEAFMVLPGDSRSKLQAFLDSQLAPAKIDDSECDQILTGLNYTTLSKSLEQAWLEHRVNLDEKDEKRYEKMFQPVYETKLATYVRAVHSKRQLLERMTEFWHDHFNIHPDRDERIAPGWAWFDRDVIRANAFGNFGKLLEGVATSPAMLMYLDNASSSRGGPNENFSRELFELHTLGSENYFGVKRQDVIAKDAAGLPVGYVDDDVYEATRAFTGWRLSENKDEPGLGNTGTFVAYTPWHDRFQKKILGKYLPPDQTALKDGKDVLEVLAAHPGTARFVCRKLVRKFISDDPPQRVIDAAAKVFFEQRNAPDQIAQVLRVIVLSDEFRTTWGEKIKRPLEFQFSMCRALQPKINWNGDLLWQLGWLGQGLFEHRPPDGYSDHRERWKGTSAMLRRWQHAHNVSHGWNEQTKVQVVNQTPGEFRTPNQLADYWLARVLPRAASINLRTEILNALRGDADANTRVPDDQLEWRLSNAVALMLMSPEFQWR
jgi:uncharacterized protein (DUF1800 family)